MAKAIFLDRDGVINRYPGDFKYVQSSKEFKFLPGVKTALNLLVKKGYKLFVISNQAGVGKGLYSQVVLDNITATMQKALLIHGVRFDGVYYCTHREEENCACRKPRTGLVKKALKDFAKSGKKITLKQSYFVGDTLRDIETGRASGLKAILIFSGKEKLKNKENWHIKPDQTFSNLREVAKAVP